MMTTKPCSLYLASLAALLALSAAVVGGCSPATEEIPVSSPLDFLVVSEAGEDVRSVRAVLERGETIEPYVPRQLFQLGKAAGESETTRLLGSPLRVWESPQGPARLYRVEHGEILWREVRQAEGTFQRLEFRPAEGTASDYLPSALLGKVNLSGTVLVDLVERDSRKGALFKVVEGVVREVSLF